MRRANDLKRNLPRSDRAVRRNRLPSIKRGMVIAMIVFALPLTVIQADKFHWINHHGGVFQHTANWVNITDPNQDPPQIPGPGDEAIFDANLNSTDSYSVQFWFGAGVDRLIMHEDNVTWELGGLSFDANSTVVHGDSHLKLRNGNFASALIEIADGAGSIGQITANTDSVFGFNSMYVGKEGFGRFELRSNAQATGSALVVGRLAGSSGHLNIHNTSELNVGSLNVGLGSVATSSANLTNSAKLIAGQIIVGNGDSFTSGRLTARRSATIDASSINIGAGGTGELELSGNATINAGFLKVGDHNGIATGNGKVTVFSGTLTARDGMVLGEQGVAEVRIKRLAHLITESNALIGADQTGDGFLQIDGGLWNSTGDVAVGWNGKARLRLDRGGQWSSGTGANIVIGELPDAEGYISVMDRKIVNDNILPSSWSLGGQSQVALKHGNARILVQRGGQIRDPSGNSRMSVGFGTDATMHISGFTTYGNQIRCAEVQVGTLHIGEYTSANGPGTGKVTMHAGGILNVNSLTLGQGAGSRGTLQLAGEKTFQSIRLPTSVNAQSLVVGGMEGLGTVRVLEGAKLYSQAAAVGSIFSSGTVDVIHEDSLWLAEGSTTIGGNQSTGRVKIARHGRMQADTLTIADGGQIVLLDGELSVNLTQSSGLFNDGSVVGYGTINGFLFVNSGYVAPGQSPGRLTVNADFEQSASGFLDMEIYGPRTQDLDILAIDGDADLDGQIAITFRGGYAPSIGDTFELISISGAVAGHFSNVEVRNLEEGFLYDASFTDGVFRLTALSDGVFVPEPGYCGLMLWFAFIAAAYRRRPPCVRGP